MRLTMIMMLCMAAIAGAQPEIAWEESFDDPACLERARFYVWDRHQQGGWDDKLLVKEFDNGVFRYGLRYDKTRKTDWVNLVYGNIVWGHKNWPTWGPFDLKRYPILEIKWRGMEHLVLYYGKETAAGKKIQDYTHPKVTRKETDAQGREWNVSIIRFAMDSSVPGPHTPTKLLGINPHVSTPTKGKDEVLEIDYIRVRGLNKEEAASEAAIIETLADFPKTRWKGHDTFFPWGVYGTGFLRGAFEWWAGDYEGAYSIYSRHHINFIATNYEVELSRAGGREIATDDWPAAVDQYAQAVAPLIQAARDNGLRRAADVRYLMVGRDPMKGYRQLLPMAKRITQQVHGDDDIIVAWTLADEPGPGQLMEMACSLRALAETDPHHRPGLVVFNGPNKMAPYVPYLPINYWDSYPVFGRRRGANRIRGIAREYRKLLPGVPMWPVLAAFETMPPNDGTYTRPSDAEMRLMAYQSIAEGAKGIVWFHGFGSSGRDHHLVHRTGHPHGGMLKTIATLGERLIPLGRQFNATDPDETYEIKIQQEEGGLQLVVSPLKYRDGRGYLLVAVNDDIDHARSARVSLPSGRGVYDLYALDGRNLRSDDLFDIAPLAGGDGRVYAVCDKAVYETIRDQILADQAREEIRSMQPDLTLAKRWGIDVSSVQRQITDTPRAARRSLDLLMANDSTFDMTRRAIEDIQTELYDMWWLCEHSSKTPKWWTGGNHPMMIPNPSHLELSKRYWKVGRDFRDIYARYLKGEKDGLWELVNRTRIACLEVRNDVLAHVRKQLAPDKEPAAK